MAGLDRSRKTLAEGELLKEASSINKSQLDLKICMSAMGERGGRQGDFIPYRNIKLTRLFKAYFEGHGLVKMVVNLNPDNNTFDESVGALKFSAIANKVKYLIKIEYYIEIIKRNKKLY